jgi:hypothetical protein
MIADQNNVRMLDTIFSDLYVNPLRRLLVQKATMVEFERTNTREKLKEAAPDTN